MSAAAAGEWRFRTLVAAGMLPALLVGLVTSAAADRLALAVWGALAAAAHLVVVRGAWSRLARPALAVLACDLVLVMLLGLVVQRHASELALGLRALAAPDASRITLP
jgi:hypothetical protein